MIKDLISQVHCVDNIDYMATIPDNFFDLVIADPEYGINVTKMNMGGRNTVKPDKTKNWDGKIPDKVYFEELFRVSKNQIIWGGNYFGLPPNKCFFIWDKGETMYGRDFAECEYAWSSFDKPADIIKINPNQADRFHPTQKPVKLYKWLLSKYAKPGDKIFDPNMGSQSSRIACYDMGFDYWGCELDKDYFEAGNNRFNQHIKQGVLF